MNLMWLGLLRLVPVWFNFLKSWVGACSIYHFSDERGRRLAIWSLITSTVCFIFAFKLEDGFLSRFLSFTLVVSLFTTEYLIYGRLGIQDVSPVSFFEGIVARWMMLFLQ
ncbi:ergosterol biosynthetic protein 28-like [Pistacia vera]|uniref:ergosterol biosynthetic protein 28-like n=1 Tax=Pistacia vera TaxID=55513 RepID=UPI001262F447|nr:ergosterol biosynthetic protein 28-like [Pistacia vera]